MTVAVPQQARSRQRYERLLDVTGLMLAQHGPEVTVRELADRAEVSIGWFYRFFPTKEALVDTFVIRALSRADARVGALPTQLDAGALAVNLLDTLVGALRQEPGLPVAWSSRRGSPLVLAADAAQNSLAVTRLVAAGASELRARVAVAAGEAALDLAFASHPDGDQAVLDEGRRLLLLYLCD